MYESYLTPTAMMDSDHESVIEFAKACIKESRDPVLMAVKLYYAVRDDIFYDPYTPFYLPKHYRASRTLQIKRGYCVSKAALLCALGRACGIPSRLGFATVRNHLATRQLIEMLGTNVFVYHGFTEFYLQGTWVKATPAFNIALCRRHNIVPLEFNGLEDSIFHPYNADKQQFMEYLEVHGSFADVPLDEIMAAWNKTYGTERVAQWIQSHEASNGKPIRNFLTEDVIQ